MFVAADQNTPRQHAGRRIYCFRTEWPSWIRWSEMEFRISGRQPAFDELFDNCSIGYGTQRRNLMESRADGFHGPRLNDRPRDLKAAEHCHCPPLEIVQVHQSAGQKIDDGSRLSLRIVPGFLIHARKEIARADDGIDLIHGDHNRSAQAHKPQHPANKLWVSGRRAPKT
ncbi:MAG: hypothetical protein ABSC37_06900 [Xanthobacteraceae bacterium]